MRQVALARRTSERAVELLLRHFAVLDIDDRPRLPAVTRLERLLGRDAALLLLTALRSDRRPPPK